MLRPRIIPCLLIKNGGLVKSIKFNDFKYVGDPINAVRIFNEKEVDELIIIDIDATKMNRDPDFELIYRIASECRMPLCYGGGVKTIEQFKQIISLGVEKIAISSSAVENPELISLSSEIVGNQSIVVVLDVKKKKFSKQYEVFIKNGTVKTGLEVSSFAKEIEKLGVGEIVINSIDRDGTMSGYDHNLIQIIRESVSLPITVMGGASSLSDIHSIFSHFGVLGASAGSLFVFKGKYRAVLINFPSPKEKEDLIKSIWD